MYQRIGRPSPALVISVIALFVALGGTGYAAATGSIDGREIKNSSVASTDVKNSSLTGTDVKNNSLTGSDVAESRLGKVPAATTSDRAANATNATNATNAANATRAGTANSATTATTATTAGSVGGNTIRKVSYGGGLNTPATTIFSGGGLTLTASCSAASDIAINATTTKTDSSIYTIVGRDTDFANPLGADLETQAFDTGTNFDLLATGAGNTNLVHFEYNALDGAVATGIIAVDEGGAGTNSCQATGHVIVG